MYKKNRIKEMIDNGQIPLGMQCFTGDPALIEHENGACRRFRIQDHVEF